MTQPEPDQRFDAAIRAIDAANAEDPRTEHAAGIARPKELLYAERMSAALLRIYPDASELLQIAARAQHLCRWQIARASYPLGREGYNAWRIACRQHHATLVAGLLAPLGYGHTGIHKIQSMILKDNLKSDPESQALENIAGLVFVEYYLEPFLAGHTGYDAAKLMGILKKTFRKMDATGRSAVLHLPLAPDLKSMIEAAI